MSEQANHHQTIENPKILVVGPIASGKSHVAKIIGESTALPVIHIDQTMMDEATDTPKPKDVFIRDIEERLSDPGLANGWVVDGNYGSIKHLTWEQADYIGYVRPKIIRNLFQAAKRGISRDTSSGNSASGPFTQISRVLKTRREEIKKCDDRVKEYGEAGAQIVVGPNAKKVALGLGRLLGDSPYSSS